MVKIRLNCTDKELTDLAAGLNNAIIAVKEVYDKAYLGVEVPQNFKSLFDNKSLVEIDQIRADRLKMLDTLYLYLLELEEDKNLK